MNAPASNVVPLGGHARVPAPSVPASPANDRLQDDITALTDADLLAHYECAKTEEATAVNLRRLVQAELVRRIGTNADGSTKTGELAGVKISTSASVTRAFTPGGVDALTAALPAPLVARLVRTKHEVDTREFNYIRDNEPDVFKIVAEHVTTKVGSYSAEIKVPGARR